jgi:hypothetical protein
MKDLLKDAIADAKAVRETALANAKLALEEAFTPRIQSMLSAKLSEELEDDEMYEGEEEEIDVEVPAEEPAAPEAPAEPAPAAPAPEMAPEEAPEPSYEDEMAEEDDDLDLEEIIRELEGAEDEVDATMAEEEGSEEEMYEEEEKEEMYEEDEDIDINEIIRALKEEEDAEEMKEEEEESSKEELEEAYNVIRFLKSKINEVNLLNAKLLYSNKLFRNFVLAEGQKMKVIENFDRAHTLREVKLVYSTLAESFKSSLERGNKKVVKESFASKPVASTKPAKQVLNEGSELAERFKKLAGLIK